MYVSSHIILGAFTYIIPFNPHNYLAKEISFHPFETQGNSLREVVSFAQSHRAEKRRSWNS